MKMRGLKIMLATALTMVTLVSHTTALSITSANYLGSIDPGSAANEAYEAAYINYLIDMVPGDTDLNVPAADVPVDGPKEYDFRRSANTFSSLGDVSAAGALKSPDDPAAGPIDISGVQYLLAKYGEVAHVWYVGNLTGNQSIPVDLGRGAGLSHYTTFRSIAVPDGGTTAALLGVAMLGLTALRRKV